MKKGLFSVIICIFSFLSVIAQAPEAFKYQAVVRDASNAF